MALPVPNLDDRRFQDLVDDAKRLVQQRCPEWTDHNVSDPGVTLIELFAWMTDQLVYRVNRVPDRNYVKFLDLIGVRLFPPTAARCPVTFWLSGPQPAAVTIPAGTQVATVRTETTDAVVFSTRHDLALVPCSFRIALTATVEAGPEEHTDDLRREQGFLAFQAQPKPGDLFYIGLSEAVPSCAVSLRLRCDLEGVGVDPTRPPLAWEAWDGSDWAACEVERDGTGGLNTDGDVVLHLPEGHAVSVMAEKRAGWIRARLLEAEAGQPFYSASPRIRSVEAFTAGGTVPALNAMPTRDELLGTSEGVPGQRFRLAATPTVPGDEPPVVEVSSEEGWQEWRELADFSQAGPGDRVFTLDRVAGEVAFGPAVRLPDGTVRGYGAVPAKGAQVRIREYLVGGGARGNVVRGALSVLKSSIPFVSEVTNRRPAEGGVDGEEIENAKLRGPIHLRALGRAVTIEDYELLAREAAPEVARVRALAADAEGEAGTVRLLVVPAAALDQGRIAFETLVPAEETLRRIGQRLDECRVIGARVVVEPPTYRGVTVVARLRARPRANPTRLQEDALRALYEHFSPLTGGPEGRGWPFGRPVHVGEVYSVLQRLRGLELVEDARVFGADPITGQRGQATQRLELEPHALVFSFEHQVLVEGS